MDKSTHCGTSVLLAWVCHGGRGFFPGLLSPLSCVPLEVTCLAKAGRCPSAFPTATEGEWRCLEADKKEGALTPASPGASLGWQAR